MVSLCTQKRLYRVSAEGIISFFLLCLCMIFEAALLVMINIQLTLPMYQQAKPFRSYLLQALEQVWTS